MRNKIVNSLIQFIKTTIVGGLLFVLPFAVVLIILREALRHVARVMEPVARLIPSEQFAGIVTAELLAIALVLLLCFVLGLIITTRPGRLVSARIEALIACRLPGFLVIKFIASGLTGFTVDSAMSVALIRFDDARALG